MDYKFIIFGIIISVIFIAATLHIYLNSYEQLLEGYWEAPLTFCSKSGIKSAQMYIKGKSAYILIDQGDRLLVNKLVEFNKSARLLSLMDDEFEYNIEFGSDVKPLPGSANMKISIKNGLLGIFADDTLYMEMFKNNKLSSGVI